MTESVLIVEDEPEFASLMQLWIQRSGRQTWLAVSGPEAMRMLWEHRPDLVTLDMGLPDLDGWTVCERIRELSDVPIIIVSARGAESERIRGLEMGADDYIVKPFSFRELMARIDAALRRTRLERRAPGILRHRALAVDPEEHRAWLDGRELDLTPLEFRLITLLAERSGRLVRHDELLRRAWGPEYAGEQQLLRSAIHGLRRKLRTQEALDGDDYIVAEYGLGYRLGPGAAPS
jgi:DNA-binding response OmpR family regulator